MLLLLAACVPIDTGFRKPDTAEPEDDTGTYTYVPPDTADTDGDLDDDGFTPEEGDCDDSDFHVSPALPEEGGDGLDNDCDGHIDEEWSGFDVGRLDDDANGSIITLDTIGRAQDEVSLSSECYPMWIDHYGDGWVLSNYYADVQAVDATGTCTLLADFSDPKVYEYGVWGIATQIDGTVLATTVASLESIATDGTITQLATWVVDFKDVTAHEFAATNVAVDPATGDIGLFDYFGGFATYDEENGFVVHKKGNWDAPDLYTTSGTHRDGGGWYTQGTDAHTGLAGIYSFDLDKGEWVLEEEWDSDSDWSPQQVAIDGDTGDWYVSANVNGIFPTVYRIVEGSGYAAPFYRIETDYAGYFYGIVSNNTYGG